MRAYSKSWSLVASAVLGVVVLNAGAATNTWQNNGIISMQIDQHNVPMISTLAVLGVTYLPYDNVGAGLQIAARSSAGNSYNPTQAGDCAQNPSKLLALNTNWNGNGIGIPSSYGFQFRVQPRNYNQPGSTCPGTGALLPYEFDFAATLGDGTYFPKQGMIMDMTVTRNAGSQTLVKGNSEFPSIYTLVNVLPFAYYSPDGVTFYPFTLVGGTNTNDMRAWPYGVNYYVSGKAVMACPTPASGGCLAMYSNHTTTLLFSHRHGASHEQSVMTLLMNNSGSISDYNPHTGIRILVVGNPQTVASVIATAKTKILNWGDL